MSGAIRTSISVVLLLLTALGLNNVYGDSSSVQKLAEAAACSGCTLHAVAVGRSPIEHTYSFQIDQTTRIERVLCRRAFIFLGAYACSPATP